MNLRLLFLLVLTAPLGVMAQCDIMFANEDSELRSVGDVLIDEDTNDRILSLTVSGSTGSEVDVVNFSNEACGTELISGTTYTAHGGHDAALLRLTEDGEVLWTTYLGGSGRDQILDIDQMPDGSIVFTGLVQSEVVFIDAGGAETTLSFDTDGDNPQDAVTGLVDPDGNLKWIRLDGGEGMDLGRTVCAGETGLAVLGVFERNNASIGTIDVSSGSGDQNDYFLLRLTDDGDPVWTSTWGSDVSDYTTERYIWDPLGLDYADGHWACAFAWGEEECEFEVDGDNQDAFTMYSSDVEPDLGVLSIADDGEINWTQPILGMNSLPEATVVSFTANDVWIATSLDGLYDDVFFSNYYSAPTADDPVLIRLDAATGIMELILWIPSGSASGVQQARLTDIQQLDDQTMAVTGYFRQSMLSGTSWEMTSTDYDAFALVVDTENALALQAWQSELGGNDGALSVYLHNDVFAVGGLSASTLDTDTGTQAWYSSALMLCDDAPHTGEVTASSSSICSGSTVTLSASDATGNLQWESRLEGDLAWTPVVGANSNDFTDSPASNTEYRLVASALGCSDEISETVLVEVSGFVVFPVLNCPSDNVERSINTCTGTYELEDFTAYSGIGPCGLFTPYQSPAAGTELSVGIHTITVGYLNGFGVLTSCTFEVEVANAFATVTLAPQTLTLADDCSATLPDLSGLATVIADCDDQNWDIYHSFGGDAMPGDDLSVGTYTVNFEALSDAGTFAFGSATVQVVDETAPTYTPLASDQITLAVGESCKIERPDLVDLLSAIDCSGVSAAVVYTDLSTGDIQPDTESSLVEGTYSAEVTLSDPYFNTTSYTFTLIAADAEGPVVTQEVFEKESPCDYIIPDFVSDGIVSVTDECSTWGVLAQFPTAGTVVELPADLSGCWIRVKDDWGNITQLDFELSVKDIVAPALTCAGPYAFAFADNNTDFVLPDFTADVSVVECGTLVGITQTPAPGTVFASPQTLTLTFEATDASSNVGSCTAELTLNDETAPDVLPIADQTVTMDADCDAAIPDLTTLIVASDALSGIASITQVPAAGTAISTATTVTLTVTDGEGNSTDVDVDVTLQDATAPEVIQLLTEVQGACTYTIPNFESAGIIGVSDACSGYTVTGQFPVEGTEYDLPITLDACWIDAEDSEGNAVHFDFVLDVNDTTAPVLTCGGPYTFDLPVDGSDFIMPNLESDVSVSSCVGVGQVIQVPGAGTTMSPTQAGTITFTVTDVSGNEGTCTASISLTDLTPPVVQPMADQVLTAGASCSAVVPNLTAMVSAYDIVSGIASITQSPVQGTVISSETTATITVTDGAGNETEIEVLLTLEDTASPDISCPGLMTVSLTDACAFELPDVTALVTASDNCSSVTLSQSMPEGTLLFPGLNSVNVMAEDESGNASSCSVTYSVVDEQAPEITCPEDQEVLLSETTVYPWPMWTDAELEAMIEANDPCFGVPTVSVLTFADELMVGESTSVLATAVDGSDNSANCSFTFTLIDDVPPVISPLDDQQVAVTVGACDVFELQDYTTAVTVDDVSSVLVTQSPEPGMIAVDPAGTLVTLTATDAAGNESTISFTVFAQDQVEPVWDCPSGPVVLVVPDDECTIGAYPSLPGVSDDCGLASATFDGTPEPLPWGPGTYTVDYLATDNAGNASSCTVVYEVEDQTSPSLTCPGELVFELPEDGSPFSLPDLTTEVSASDCSGVSSLDQSISEGTTYTEVESGIEISVTATDNWGNEASCEILVSIVDTGAPVFAPIEDDTLPADLNCEAALPNYLADVVIFDGAGAIVSTSQFPPAGTFVSETGEVVLTATDDSGNTAEIAFNVTVVDQTPPVLDCDGLPTELNATDCTYEMPDWTLLVTATDNCDSNPIVTQNISSGTPLTPSSTAYEVEFTAQDEAGNSTTCTHSFTVVDQVTPVLDCPSDVEVFASDIAVYPYPVPDAVTPVASDPCGETLEVSATTDQEFLEMGQSVNYLLNVSDPWGNEVSCVYSLTLIDDVGPEVEALSDTTVYTFSDDCSTFELPDFEDLVVAEDPSGISIISQWPQPGILNADQAPVNIDMQVIDGAGNVTYVEFTVNVLPNLPTEYAHEDDTLFLTESCSAVLADYTPEGGVLDVCGGSYNVIQIPAPGTEVFAGQTIPLTFYLEDYPDHEPLGTMQVTVQDDAAPVWECPGVVLVAEADESCLAEINLLTPEVTDHCGVVSIDVTGDDPSGQYAPGSYTTTFTATDAQGLSSSCSVSFEVHDVLAPELVCPESIVTCNPVVSWDLPAVTDACGVEEQSITLISDPLLGPGASFPIGTTPIQYGIADLAGNPATCAFTVTVEVLEVDYELPFDALCKTDIPVTLEYTGQGTMSWGGAASVAGVLTPISLGPGTHEVTATLELEGCVGSQSYELVIDETPEATLTNLPEQWCMEGGALNIELNSSNPAAEWTWQTPVQADGTLAQADMTAGEMNLSCTGVLGSCQVEQQWSLNIVENIEFTWATLPEKVCEDGASIPLNVEAPAGSTIAYNTVVGADGVLDVSHLDPSTYTIEVTASLPGCSLTQTQQITVVAMPSLDAGNDFSVCGPTTSVSAWCSDPDANVSWSTGSSVSMTDPNAWVSTVNFPEMGPMLFEVVAVSQEVCTVTDEVQVLFTPPPAQPNAGPDQHLELETSTQLEGTYNGPSVPGSSLLWKPIQTPAELDDPADLNTGVHYLQHGKNTFQLVAATGPACQPRIDSVDVWVNLVWSIPSGFSPNGDRVNDFFVVDGLDDPAHLVVFNRWGEQVFEDRQFLNNWNGHSSQNKPLPDDTYFYLLEVAGEAFDGYLIIKR